MDDMLVLSKQSNVCALLFFQIKCWYRNKKRFLIKWVIGTTKISPSFHQQLVDIKWYFVTKQAIKKVYT